MARFKTALASILLLYSAPLSAALRELPKVLDCNVSGKAGCGDSIGRNICVGAGTRDPSIRLRVDVAGRTLSLNGITGRVGGSNWENLQNINWRHHLVALDEVRLTRFENGLIFASLTDRHYELEFRCTG